MKPTIRGFSIVGKRHTATCTWRLFLWYRKVIAAQLMRNFIFEVWRNIRGIARGEAASKRDPGRRKRVDVGVRIGSVKNEQHGSRGERARLYYAREGLACVCAEV